MDRINSTISKFGELAKSIKEREKSSGDKLPEMGRRIQELEGENATLMKDLAKLEEKSEKKERTAAEEKKKDQMTIADLEKQLQKKAK